MPATLNVRYGGDEIDEKVTVLHVEVSDLPFPNDVYRIEASHDSAAADDLVSVVFSNSQFTWDNLLMPEDGAWSFRVYNVTKSGYYQDASPYVDTVGTGRAWAATVTTL